MSGQTFISYRRSDSLGSAGRLYDHLLEHLGPERVFMDVDTIAPGVDFVEAIEQDHAPLVVDLDEAGHPLDAGWTAAEGRIASRRPG